MKTYWADLDMRVMRLRCGYGQDLTTSNTLSKVRSPMSYNSTTEISLGAIVNPPVVDPRLLLRHQLKASPSTMGRPGQTTLSRFPKQGLPGDEHGWRSIRSMHGAAFIGLIVPVLGHLVPIVITRHRLRTPHPAMMQHIRDAWDFHLFWGCIMTIEYAALLVFGIPVLPLVLLSVMAWITQSVMVLSKLESGRMATFRWYLKL